MAFSGLITAARGIFFFFFCISEAARGFLGILSKTLGQKKQALL